MIVTVVDYGLDISLKYGSSQSNTHWFSSIVKTIVILESYRLHRGLLEHTVLHLFSK